MLEVKQKALDKMLEEMNKEHSGAEDVIHNWLCDQEDDKLFKGILQEGKTIKDAVNYCISQAQKQKSDNCAMVDDKTVFGWVYKYFTGKKEKIETIAAQVSVGQNAIAEKPKKLAKPSRKEKGVVDGQLDLFGALV